jgi:hypothetical protein
LDDSYSYLYDLRGIYLTKVKEDKNAYFAVVVDDAVVVVVVVVADDRTAEHYDLETVKEEAFVVVLHKLVLLFLLTIDLKLATPILKI